MGREAIHHLLRGLLHTRRFCRARYFCVYMLTSLPRLSVTK